MAIEMRREDTNARAERHGEITVSQSPGVAADVVLNAAHKKIIFFIFITA
jgi:hypothetical protein